jgi:hypothetical protein
MIGKIVLWIYDRKGAPWVGEWIFDAMDPPCLHENGALRPEGRRVLVDLARCIHVWHPYDNALAGSPCKPRSIYEALWVWLEAGTQYYKFQFRPPLEIENDAPLQGF